ncbi:unnamed protein product [Dicrocoelium dendriticum]|nr:unnamed protein product [Dicrocoelium dendriticum]
MVPPVRLDHFMPRSASTPKDPRRPDDVFLRPMGTNLRRTSRILPQSEKQINVSHGPDAPDSSARVRNKRNSKTRRLDPETASRLSEVMVPSTSRAPLRPSTSCGTQQQTQKSTARSSSTLNKSKRRRRCYRRVFREIHAYQKTSSLLIRKLPFSRVVRSIAIETIGPRINEFRWQAVCFLALQEAAEAFLVCLLECAQKCAFHAKRITVMPKDVQLVTDLQNIPTPQTKIRVHYSP